MSLAPLKAIIIDDEKGARDILGALLLKHCTEINIIAQAASVPDGVLAINKNKPDLVFLDIEMPEYNGFELLDFFSEITFEIVFVTAYSHYAIQAFEVSAIDYLLKPVEAESVVQAIEKVRKKRQYTNIQKRLELLKESRTTGEINRIAFPMNDGLIFTDVSSIIMFEAERSYCHVYLANGSKLLLSKSMNNFEDLLTGRSYFFRPHRSFLINMNYMRKYLPGTSEILMDNNVSVSVARERKALFESLLKELKFSI